MIFFNKSSKIYYLLRGNVEILRGNVVLKNPGKITYKIADETIIVSEAATGGVQQRFFHKFHTKGSLLESLFNEVAGLVVNLL